MANARAVIDIDVNTSPAAAGLRSLQSQINGFSSALNKANTEQGLAAKGMARQLSDLVNSSKFFTAETVRMQTSAAQLDSTLKKGQVTMGQFFSAKFRKDGLAAAQVMSLANARASALQTQFIQVGAAAGGMREALAIRPLQAFNTAATVSAQTLAIHRAMLQQATTSMINFGKNTQWAGRQLMVGFTVPLTIFGGLASKTFRELEAEAINFKKVYGDIFTTDEETQAAMQNVQDLASEFTKYGIAVKDTMALAGVAAQSGLRNAELMAATTQATRLATLGQMEQADAMKTIISLQTAFKASNDELAESVDFLNIIENQTVLSLQDVAGAIPRVAPVIQGLGGDVKDLAVLLVAMKEGGVSAGEGANALKSSLGRLITPTKRALDMAAGFGINLEKIVQNNRGQVVPMIQELAQAMSSLEGLEQQQLLSTLFGKFQYARIGALFKSLTDDSSQAARAMGLINMEASQLAEIADKELSVVEEATGTKMVAAMERLKVAIAPIGEMFLKMATPIINFLASIAEKFNNLPDFAKRFIGLATVITGLVIPAGTMFLGLLMNLVGTLTKFGHLIGIAFKGFLSGGIQGAFNNVSQALKYMSLQEIDAANAATQLAGTTKAVNAALLDQVGKAQSSTAAIMGLAGAYDILVQNMRESMLVGGLPMAVPGQAGLRAGRSGLLYKPLPIVARNKGGSIPYMSTGSTVPGTGNKDTVPAMLTPGEFVVNKQATEQNMGLLHAINNGDVQYRNKGGGIAKTGRGYYGVRPNPFALAAQQARARLEEFESSRSAIAQTFGLPFGGSPRSSSAFGTIRTTQVSSSRRSRDIFDAVVGTNTKAARMLRAAESLGISKDEMGLKQVGNFVLAMSPSSNVKMANGTLAKQRLLAELDNPGAFDPLSQQLRKYFGKSLDDRLFDEIYRQQIALLPESGITNALFEKASRNALRVYLDRSGFDRTSRKAFLRDVLSPDSVRGNLTRDRIRQALRSRGIIPNEKDGDIKAIVNGEEFNFGDLAGRTFTRLGRPQGITRYDDLDVAEGLERVHANKGGLIPGVQYLRGGGVTAALRSMLSSFSVKGSSARSMLEGITTRTRNAPSAFRTFRRNLIGDEINIEILKDAARLGGWKSKGVPMPSRYKYIATAHIEEDMLKSGKFWQARNLRYTSNAENDILNNLFKNTSSSKKKSILSILEGSDKDFADILMSGYHPSSKEDYKRLDRILTAIQKSSQFKKIFGGRYDEADIAILSGLAKLRYSTSKSAQSLRSQIDDPFNMFTGDVLTVEDLLSNVVFRNKGGEIFESAKKTLVPGVGNKDTVPAALTPGEFVINKQATQANKPLLQAINSGKTIAMNKGGLIPGMQYLNPGGMAQRLAQQSRAMSSKSIYTKSEVEDIFGNIRPTYRLKDKDQDYMFRGYGEKPGVIGKTSTVKELDATPESLLSEAIILNPNDTKLKSMLSNFKNKNFGKDEVSLLDDIAGAMAINNKGEFSAKEKTSGLALVLAALSGDEQARSSVNIKKQAFYRKVEEARKKEIERNKAIEAQSEAASLDELAFVHSTRHKIDRGSDGTITLKPAAYHNLGTDDSYPRSSVHFTINSKVEDHVMGSWDAANKLIVTSGRKVIDANNNPAALRSIDTFWEIGPGQNMVLRNASVVSPHNDQSIYKRELMNRGIADVDGQLPFLVDDAARNDVLYFTKAADDYTDADRIRIMQDLGKNQREAEILAATIKGQESSLIEREALKRAMQQQKVAAEPESLGQWGYSYNRDLDARIAALAKRRGISGEIHAGTPSAQLEKSAVMPMGYDYNRFNGANINSYRWLIASGHTKTKSTSPKLDLNFMDGNTGGMVPGVQYFARNMMQRVVQPFVRPGVISNPYQQKHIERKLATWLSGGMARVNVRELTSLGLARRHEETELFRGMPIRSLTEGSSPRFTPEVHEALYRYARTKDPKELDGILGRPIAIGARSFSKSRKTAEEFAENISEKDASFVFKIRDEKGIYGIDPYQEVGTSRRQSESYRELRREYKRKEKEIIPVGSPEKGRPDVVVGRIALDKDGSIVIDTGAKLSRREIATVTKEYDEMVGARYTPRSVIRDARSEIERLQAKYQRLKSKKDPVTSKEAGDLYAEISRLETRLLSQGLNPRTSREKRSLIRLGESIRSMSNDLTSMFNAARTAGLNKGGFISPTLQMNNGNIVPGMGNKDTVPAMLTPGEFVVNQRATQENLSLLHAINSGNAVGMNKGGKVPGIQYLNGGGQVYKMMDGWYADDGKGGVRGPYRTEMSANLALRRMGGSIFRNPMGSSRTPGSGSSGSGMMPGGGMMRGMGVSMAGSMGGMGLMTIGENMKQSAAAQGQSSATGQTLSNVGMGAMLLSQLAFLPPSILGPLLAIGAPIAGIAGGLALFETHSNNAAMAAAEMAAGINGTIHPLKKMGEFLGIQTPAQRQAQINLGISQEEKETFQQQFGEIFSTEEGMLFVDELKRATSEQRFQKLSNYLRYAVASEMMDRESAKTFARVISSEIGDSFLGARISSILSKQGSGSNELLELGLERDVQAQEKKSIQNVKSSEERSAAGLLGGVSLEDSAAAITLSSLALQDFSNASALAFEELTSGQISVEEYQKVVDESRKKQGEYTRVLVEAIDKTGKFGSSMQVLKDQFMKMGFDETMFKDIENNLIKSSEKQTTEQMEEMGYWQRQWAIVRDRLSLETMTAIGPPTTRKSPEENMAEDIKNNVMPYVSAAIFEGMEPMLAQNIGIEILVNDEMDEDFENIAEKFGARLALESEIVMKKINEGEIIDFTTGIDQVADRIPEIIANRKEKVEQIFDEFIERGGKPDQFLTWLQSIPEEKSFDLVVEFGGLSKREQQDYLSDVSSFAQAYGQEFQLAFQQSDFYKNLLGKGTTRGLRESLSFASETGLSERVINYSIKESNKETTPDQLANRIDSLTNSFIKLESLPEEVRKTLRIDINSGIDLEKFGPFTEEIQSGWELIDSLDADVAKELVANSILLDGQGNVRSFEDMAYEIGNLNIAYKSLENLSPEIRKQAIIDIATNLGEGDPNALMGRILADIPDFYELGGGQQAFILEQYGQAFSRTQAARDALEENERQRQEILDERQREPDHLGTDDKQQYLDQLEEERKSLEKTAEGYMAYEQAKAAAIASGAGFTVGPDLMGALGLSYTDDVFKNNAKEIADAWDIMQGLPQELDLSLVARFMVFGNGNTPLDAEEVAKQGKVLVKAFRNLQSEDPEKRMAGQEAIGLAYAMQVIGGPELVDEEGNSVSAEEVRNRAFEELKAQFPDFGELSIEVQGAMITSRIDYIVEGAALAARNAELEKNLQSALAAGDSEAARMISRQIEANNRKIGQLKETAEAVSEVQYRKPPKTTSGGGGGGEKSLSDQMKDQLDLLQDTYDGLDRFINSKTGVFKKFISGPFGPQFIEFLKSQGKKGIDILKGDLDKFKKLYGQYLAIQMQSAENAIQILPQSIKSQTMQAVGMRMITDRLGRQGFSKENVEMVMSQFEDPNAIAEAYAVARRRKKKGKDITDEQQELLDMFSPGNMKQILDQIKKFNAEAREQFVQTKEEALELENEFRNTLSGRNISPEVIDMLLEMGYTSKDLETNLEDIVGHAQRLDNTLAQTNFADSMEGMNREIDQANFALELMGQGVGPEAAAAISQIGLAGQLSNQQIQEFVKTFEELEILQMAMQDPAQLRLQQLQGQENINQLKYEIELLQNINKNETISALYAKEKVSNHEDLLEVYERQNDLKSREIELEQRKLEPIDEAIEKLEEQKTQISESYEAQFEALDALAEKENRINDIREGRLDVANALSRGDVAGAAQAAIEMQRRLSEKQQDSVRSALEKQRQEELDAVDEQINQKRDERKVIEEEIKKLQLEQRDIQDQIYNVQLIINEEAARLEDKYELGNRQIEILQQELILAQQEQDKLTQAIDKSVGSARTLAELLERIARLNAGQGGGGGAPSGGGGAPSGSSLPPGTTSPLAPGVSAPSGIGNQQLSNSAVINAMNAQYQSQGMSQKAADDALRGTVAELARQQNTTPGAIWAAHGQIESANLGRMYGGKINKLMFGGSVNYRGSREAPPGMMMGGKVKKFAFGSMVPGRGMTDKVPALLTPGEFVVRKSVAQQIMPTLKAMNSQVFPGMGIPQQRSLNVSNPQFDTMKRMSVDQVRYGIPQSINSFTYPTTNMNITQSNTDMSPTNYNVGPSNVQYTYNLNVTTDTNASPDEIADTVMYKIKRFDDRRIRGTQVG